MVALQCWSWKAKDKLTLELETLTQYREGLCGPWLMIMAHDLCQGLYGPWLMIYLQDVLKVQARIICFKSWEKEVSERGFSEGVEMAKHLNGSTIKGNII